MNIIQVFELFPTQESCVEYLEKVRWGDKPVCPYCGSTHTIKNEKRHHCYDCKTGFSVTVGTIFHHTHMPLQKWFLAISLMLNARKGLSSMQLSRDLEVNKNTAHRISMQIRKAMTQKGQRELLTGICEMDEAYIGGKPRRGNKSGGPQPDKKRGRGTDKVPVVGVVERGGKVKAKTTTKGRLKGRNLRAFVRQSVNTADAHLMTDEYKGYIGMNRIVPHSVIRHSRWYVDGDIHTNSIESFWALLKRGMFGQFHSVSKRHLQRYVDEFCYRFNARDNDATDTFHNTISLGLGVRH